MSAERANCCVGTACACQSLGSVTVLKTAPTALMKTLSSVPAGSVSETSSGDLSYHSGGICECGEPLILPLYFVSGNCN